MVVAAGTSTAPAWGDSSSRLDGVGDGVGAGVGVVVGRGVGAGAGACKTRANGPKEGANMRTGARTAGLCYRCGLRARQRRRGRCRRQRGLACRCWRGLPRWCLSRLGKSDVRMRVKWTIHSKRLPATYRVPLTGVGSGVGSTVGIGDGLGVGLRVGSGVGSGVGS